MLVDTKAQTKDREIDKLKIFLLLSKNMDASTSTMEKDQISGLSFFFWKTPYKYIYVPLCVYVSNFKGASYCKQ